MKMLTNVRGLASISGWRVAIVALAFLVVVGITMAGMKNEAGASTAQAGREIGNVPDVPPPNVDDPISDTELRDLQTIASQQGMSLQAAIDRYAWNDNFALAATSVRKAFPEAFTGAEIVDAHNAWIAFKGQAPDGARAMMDAFTSSHPRVAVSVRTDMGFTEVELQRAIETVHYAMLQRPEVRDAITVHDYATGTITTTVVLEDTASDSVPDDLRAVAEQSLIAARRENILESIRISVVRSTHPVIGGIDSNSEHLGGEIIGDCTSGFATETLLGVRGIASAGHCSNGPFDDGLYLAIQAEHLGTHGDFQWLMGPNSHADDFYAGSESSVEYDRRDVSSVGSPFVGQSLCRNGKTTYKKCEVVRALNVCGWGGACNLVEMGTRTLLGGDSGGPVYWNNTVHGLNQGYVSDPWPFERDVFSRADRLDDALGIYVATY